MKRFTTVFLAIVLAASMALAGDRPLRILAIGNSFSDDGMQHLPAMLANMGVDNVELARLYVGGCSLARHCRFIRDGESPYKFYRSAAGSGKWELDEQTRSLSYALELGEWDIITMQQASGDSGLEKTYFPHVDSLVAYVRHYQPNAKLAWHTTWSYSSGSDHKHFPRYGNDSQRMYAQIIETVEVMLNRTGCFSYVIPTGTAVNIIRKTRFNNAPLDFTRDGFHLDYGAGRFLAACTWYEALIAPYTGRKLATCTLNIDKGNIPVTPDVRKACIQAARKAVKTNPNRPTSSSVRAKKP